MAALDMEKYRQRLGRLSPVRRYGTVARMSGLVIEAFGPAMHIGQLCEIVDPTDLSSTPAEVIGFRDRYRLLLPLERAAHICPGSRVTPLDGRLKLNLGAGLLGRVVDGLGRPIDGKGTLVGCDHTRPLEAAGPAPLSREPIGEPLATGVRGIDGVLTFGRGQRIGIFAGSGVGKSTLLGEIAKTSSADVNVLALVGERGREVRHFLEESLGPEGLAKSVIVVATSDNSAVMRTKAALVATTIAEYFRDQGRDVMFMMDSITRLAHAYREIGLAVGEPPTTKGYPPSVFQALPRVTERLGRTGRGSITGVYTVLVEADDMNEPVADATRSLLDGHIVLSRKLADRGHYPAIDIMASVSRVMPDIVSPGHLDAARKLKAIYATYEDAEDLISVGAIAPGANPRIDQAMQLIGPVTTFLQQGIGERSAFDETVEALVKLTSQWTGVACGPHRFTAEAQPRVQALLSNPPGGSPA